MSTVLIVHAGDRLDTGWYAALEKTGHTVLAAQAIDEGILRVREGGVDVVVLDGPSVSDDLPVFVGALERLPDAPPYVLVSSSPHAPELSARFGAAAFVPTPCSAGELCHVLGRLLASGVVRSLDEDEPTDPIERTEAGVTFSRQPR